MKNLEELKRLQPIAETYRAIYPSESTCGICGLPWSACGPKIINISGEGLGVFYVCPYCFKTQPLKEVLKATAKGYAEQLRTARRSGEEKAFIEHHDFTTIIANTAEEHIKGKVNKQIEES